MPNSISSDGSTVNVYIDGVAKGHVIYNIARGDIAALFPGYANSSGAGGYLDIDTTRFADGLHTIAWVATDSAGNSDGVGSRYFSVRNTGGDAVLQAPDLVTINVPLDKLMTGMFVEEPMLIQTRELERVEINLGFKCRGYLAVGDHIKPLPVGSTLDGEKGIFYWQPGPGFVGDYRFEFVGFDSTTGEMIRKPVKIKILPKFPASPGREITMER
jgi:hypothetical protein